MHAENLPLRGIDSMCIPKAYHIIKINKSNEYCRNTEETEELMGLFFQGRQHVVEDSGTANDMEDNLRAAEVPLTSGMSLISR